MMRRPSELDTISTIIDALIKRRKDCGLSHQKLAEKAQLNRSAISLIESKKRIPSLLTILKICHAVDISLADLLKQYE